tara:strand:+ start:126 stop:323 length:198 start_codon:yes stop_codon:yes gene_type:complete
VAVQQLGKKQAKKEKKNQKALDDEFERDEEKALEDTQRMLDQWKESIKKVNRNRLNHKDPQNKNL